MANYPRSLGLRPHNTCQKETVADKPMFSCRVSIAPQRFDNLDLLLLEKTMEHVRVVFTCFHVHWRFMVTPKRDKEVLCHSFCPCLIENLTELTKFHHMFICSIKKILRCSTQKTWRFQGCHRSSIQCSRSFHQTSRDFSLSSADSSHFLHD